MVVRLRLFGLLSFASALTALSGGCNTGAVAVKECREIEYLRCEASVSCEVADIETDEDVAECKRFYKNQCLHGIAGPEGPSAQRQTDCMAALNAAAACAAKDKDGPVADCAGVPTEMAPDAAPFTDVCDVMGRPWHLALCDFMLPAATGAGGSE